MKPAAFDYFCPETLEETLELLAEFGDDAKVLAGGQSLVPTMNMRLARPNAVVDINRLPALDGIQIRDGVLWFGALVRQSDAGRSATVSDAAPLIARALPYVGHWQTRNRGTICGSLAHADPSAELPLVAVALDGSIEARSTGNSRQIPADRFFESYFMTALRPDELITAASFRLGEPPSGYAFEEFSERYGDFAIAAVACALTSSASGEVTRLRLVLGGVDERPHLVQTGAWLGRRLTNRDLEDLAEQATQEIDPPADQRGTSDYRRWLIFNLTKRALTRAMAEAYGEGVR